MKKITRPVLAILILAAFTISCHKEQTPIPPVQTVDAAAVRSVYYVVGGELRRVSVAGNAAMYGLLDSLLSLAESGTAVRVGEGGYPDERQYTKETVTFTTPDKKEANEWVDMMLASGYEVSMYFDTETGVFVCIAYKK